VISPSVYASLEPISHDLPHEEIVALVAKRVEDVDWQAFKTSFDIHTSTLRSREMTPSQALKNVLGATQTLDAQLQEPNANDGDPRPDQKNLQAVVLGRQISTLNWSLSEGHMDLHSFKNQAMVQYQNS
jgi:hypothetical protein